MEKNKTKKCNICENDKRTNDFYASDNPNHKDGCIDICKNCARNMIDEEVVETLISFLRRVDRPFILNMWKKAKVAKMDTVASYFSSIAMVNRRSMGFEDSEGLEEIEGNKGSNKEDKQKKKDKKQEELDEIGMTQEELDGLRRFWGNGHTPTAYQNYQEKYDSLIGNYNQTSAFVIEGLQTYCVYKCKAETETAKGNINDAKEWSRLAITQADKAKISLSSLSAEDLSQGVNSFSEVAKLVEKEVDIIPILPQFISKPNDPIDVALLSFINYNRRMQGLEDVEHHEIYGFYQEKLKEFKENKRTSEIVKKNIVEKEIITESGKRVTILFYDVYKVIEQKKEDNKGNKFIQNLDKWMELVSYLRWFPDTFYEILENKEYSGIRLSQDQRLILRIFSRMPFNYTVFPRGYGKTMLNVMSMYHACILYPNLTYAMTAQTRESSAKLINSKIREIEDSYPMVKEEVDNFKFQKEDIEVKFKSGGTVSNLANNRASLGLRRHKLMVEEYAQCDEDLLTEVIYPIVDIPRRTIGKLGVMSPYENNGGMSFITTSYFVNTPPYYKGIDMMKKMVDLEGNINIGADFEVALAYGRGAPRSAIMDKKASIPILNFKQNYESIWVKYMILQPIIIEILYNKFGEPINIGCLSND